MAESQVLGFGSGAAPIQRVTKDSEDFVVLAVNANFDGSAAASSYLPCVEIVSDSGNVVARCVADTSVAAGGSAEVTFAPFLRGATTSAAGIQFGIENDGTWLDVRSSTGGGTTGQGIHLESASQIGILSTGSRAQVEVDDTGADQINKLDVQDGSTRIRSQNVAGTHLAQVLVTSPVGGTPEVDISASDNGSLGIIELESRDYTRVTAHGATTNPAVWLRSFAGDVNIDAAALCQLTCDANASSSSGFAVVSDNSTLPLGTANLMVLKGVTNGASYIRLPTTGTLTVLDVNGNPLFRVNANGDLQGKTGKALTFNL